MEFFEGQLSLELLEKAYQSVVFGYTEPQILRVNQNIVKKLLDMYRLAPPIKDKQSFLFNNAVITPVENWPENLAEFETVFQHGPAMKAQIKLV